MAIFKEILPSDIKSAKSFLSQLIDVLQEDISGSTSRRKYQVFVTGTTTSVGVTSSLYQTVYDQDFSLQTANPIFDITFGLNPAGTTVTNAQVGTDSAGKELFRSSSLMMREKIGVYKQFAQALLGDGSETFTAAFDSTSVSDEIDVAMFICFKRLFARDAIKRETFAMRWFQTASINYANNGVTIAETFARPPNLFTVTTSGSAIYTDIGAATNKLATFGGQVGNIVDSANTTRNVGLMFYDRGVAVFDLAKITSASQFVSGTISSVAPLGTQVLGKSGTENAFKTKFIPDFVVSASMDNVIDHLSAVRFGTGSLTAMTFQNVTNINSTLIFCRASADEMNYSSNPTYTDDENRIVVIDAGAEDVQQSFTFITCIGLYDANDNLLAVSKVSRPIEKNAERDLTLRIRLDY